MWRKNVACRHCCWLPPAAFEHCLGVRFSPNSPVAPGGRRRLGGGPRRRWAATYGSRQALVREGRRRWQVTRREVRCPPFGRQRSRCPCRTPPPDDTNRGSDSYCFSNARTSAPGPPWSCPMRGCSRFGPGPRACKRLRPPRPPMTWPQRTNSSTWQVRLSSGRCFRRWCLSSGSARSVSGSLSAGRALQRPGAARTVSAEAPGRPPRGRRSSPRPGCGPDRGSRSRTTARDRSGLTPTGYDPRDAAGRAPAGLP